MSALLAALVTFAIANAPEIAHDVEALVEAFKKQHPELADPPIADAEDAVNKSFDASLAARGLA